MTPEAFVYWLQGHFELNPSAEGLSNEQVAVIKRHLHLVFEHIDTPDPDGKLQAVHDGKPPVEPDVNQWGNKPGVRC